MVWDESSMKKVKVVLLSPLPPPVGGMATWTKLYSDFLKKNGIEHAIVNTAVIGERIKSLKAKKNIVLEFRRNTNILIELIKYIKKINPRIVHINNSGSSFAVMRDIIIVTIVKISGLKTILHFHCNLRDCIHSSLQLVLSKILFRLSDEVIVLNNDSQLFAKEQLKTDTSILANFVPNDWILERNKKINSEVSTILYVGQVRPEKGIDDLIRIAKINPSIKFIVAGPVMSDYNIESFPENVNLIGTVNSDQVRSLLDEADIFLFLSRSEGFSISLLEAMARGLPIIATSVGANNQMIENHGGIIVNPGDISGINHAINKLKNCQVREKASFWNVNKVKQNYTVDVVMNELIRKYYSM